MKSSVAVGAARTLATPGGPAGGRMQTLGYQGDVWHPVATASAPNVSPGAHAASAFGLRCFRFAFATSRRWAFRLVATRSARRRVPNADWRSVCISSSSTIACPSSAISSMIADGVVIRRTCSNLQPSFESIAPPLGCRLLCSPTTRVWNCLWLLACAYITPQKPPRQNQSRQQVVPNRMGLYKQPKSSRQYCRQPHKKVL